MGLVQLLGCWRESRTRKRGRLEEGNEGRPSTVPDSKGPRQLLRVVARCQRVVLVGARVAREAEGGEEAARGSLSRIDQARGDQLL